MTITWNQIRKAVNDPYGTYNAASFAGSALFTAEHQYQPWEVTFRSADKLSCVSVNMLTLDPSGEIALEWARQHAGTLLDSPKHCRTRLHQWAKTAAPEIRPTGKLPYPEAGSSPWSTFTTGWSRGPADWKIAEFHFRDEPWTGFRDAGVAVFMRHPKSLEWIEI